MSERALITRPNEILTVDDEFQALMAEEAAGDIQAFELKPPKFKISSQVQMFQNELTGDVYRTLEGVISMSKENRGWFEEGNNIPLCSSKDCITGIMRDGKSKRCAPCPQNEWGSNPKGGKGKACGEKRRLIFAITDAPIPIILTIPSTSVVTFDEYCSGLMLSKPQRYYFAVVTKMSLEKATNPAGQDYSKVKFEKVRDLTIGELRYIKTVRDEFQRFIPLEDEPEDTGNGVGNGHYANGHYTPAPLPDTYDDDPGPAEEPREAYTTKQNGMDF